MGIAIEDHGPAELGEAVGLALGLGGIVELREGVVLQHEAQTQAGQLLGQPIVTVDIDLQCERQPGLQADVNQAELRIEKVVIEHALLARPRDQPRPPLAGNQLKRIASFQRTENADQSRSMRSSRSNRSAHWSFLKEPVR